MGKSTASCFKIIACGKDSVDHDDLETPESKGSSDRRGWSFRKRSARHRVLSNTVISEAPPSVNKESPESTVANSQVQADLTVPEKTSVIQWAEEKTELPAQQEKIELPAQQEKIELPAQQESKLSDIIAASEEDCKTDEALDESNVIVIQAAIRGMLAQNVLLKQKNIIKLQAVVRGHLVRSRAVGTLRCVQAIVKMQALVRARQARLGSLDLTHMSKKEANPNGTCTYVSMEKLLGNRFARQLMDSSPRTKPINIKCDPLKSDSSWKWLERWMSVSYVSNEEPHEKENLGHSDGKDILAPSDCDSVSIDFKPGVDAPSVESSENDDGLITYEAKSISPSSSHSELQNIDQSNASCNVTESALVDIKVTDLAPEVEAKSLPEKEETLNEQPEIEVKRLSRKASNPAFIAAQSKFEELTLSAASAKLTPSSSLDKVSSSSARDVEELAENAISNISNAPAVQIGGSECGTELSISSTLDSPDRSEAEVNNLEKEPKAISEENSELEKANEKPVILEEADQNKLERFYSANDSMAAVEAPLPEKKKPEADFPSEIQREVESEASRQVYKSSPEASSPRSHITIPESQAATPSSQVSVKPKKPKSNNGKNRSADKKTSNQDSTASKSSVEHNKNGKRRNSFGSAKPDHNKEQEPRDSSSSISLPSYMQATQSAKAKAIAVSGSPRSSPDVHDKDNVYIKKRHSLPGVNDRQGSPRIQRSLSQAQQQNGKGNGNLSPQAVSDRKWKR